MRPGEDFWKRLDAAQELGARMRAQDRLRRLRSGKTVPRTADEAAQWCADVDDPAPTLRRITHDTRPKMGKVVATPGPHEGERVWWVDGVTYTADPDVIRMLARKRTVVEDAPDGIPAEYTARVEAEQRRRAEREARRADRRPGATSH
ncbi:hypothetical protein [Nocardiopsis sp. NRRL B-16309]|uniref:hypothetical protein n=1 Tax=Nocardiopsis sp. NRRL B-16309 TaxID=1519494 RepID=UPI000AA5CF18|nr:hypothetical protein [Nocardiopsis sp. NRRL B-16309]